MATDEHIILKEHPCFGPCKKNKGRIHLPVAPGCNIECRFCDRKINEDEQRPGVTSAVLEPEEAAGFVELAIEKCPEITVVGIAGPGDTLATDRALKTFRLLRGKFPKLIRCMSTNGLLLDEKAEEVAELIDTLTVTVNAVDPEIQAQINNKIIYHGKIYTGIEAAKILIRNQLSGIRKVAKAGTLVKVNTVLVPGINDKHIEEVAATVKAAGASIYNIIPLIPQNDMKDIAAPTCEELHRARQEAELYINVFRHCQHCRADAVGVPGVYDIGAKLYQGRLSVKETFSHG
ncbi:radical SAM protein [Butyrivibrio sp. AE3004]|uniref:radical SAM protein n=1 Tax=Butyrivibrio sp. AE3004 TaxID=1506994 RepID=UPI000494938C|nr:radical SAM protein [Butyrivibrio sp. AE3004]